jgi:3-deoxy-D-manno-octulosonate 8-phosphate phosphatase KdsC-like HAD superfamily phosphatase
MGNKVMVGKGMNAAAQKLMNLRKTWNLTLNDTVMVSNTKTTIQLLIKVHTLMAMAMGYCWPEKRSTKVCNTAQGEGTNRALLMLHDHACHKANKAMGGHQRSNQMRM